MLPGDINLSIGTGQLCCRHQVVSFLTNIRNGPPSPGSISDWNHESIRVSWSEIQSTNKFFTHCGIHDLLSSSFPHRAGFKALSRMGESCLFWATFHLTQLLLIALHFSGPLLMVKCPGPCHRIMMTSRETALANWGMRVCCPSQSASSLIFHSFVTANA